MPVSGSPPIRILLIDDHTLVRAGLRMLIESRPGLQVVGEAVNRHDVLALAACEQPDLILLDLDLGGSSGLDFLPELLSVATAARVLILTGVYDLELHRRAVRLGAMGVVVKEKAAEILFQAIEKVHAGEVWLERAMVASVLGEMTRRGEPAHTDPEAAKIAALTAREREVIVLVGEGLKNRQIAQRLFISETTVRHHLTSIFGKLGVADRLELVIYAYRHSLAKIPR
jgi:DNA-binding NarL/FixJ family response regulator